MEDDDVDASISGVDGPDDEDGRSVDSKRPRPTTKSQSNTGMDFVQAMREVVSGSREGVVAAAKVAGEYQLKAAEIRAEKEKEAAIEIEKIRAEADKARAEHALEMAKMNNQFQLQLFAQLKVSAALAEK